MKRKCHNGPRGAMQLQIIVIPPEFYGSGNENVDNACNSEYDGRGQLTVCKENDHGKYWSSDPAGRRS